MQGVKKIQNDPVVVSFFDLIYENYLNPCEWPYVSVWREKNVKIIVNCCSR